MADLNPQIVITAKDEASKVFKQVGDESKNLGQQLGQKLKDNVAGITAAFGLATGAVLTSIGAFTESQDTLAQLDAVLQSTGQAAKKQGDEFAKASKTMVTGTKASGKEITEWKGDLEKAQAKLADMTASMKDNDKVSESTKLRYKDLTAEVTNLQTKIGAGSQTFSTTLAKSMGLIPPVAQLARDELVKLSATLQQQSKFGDEAILSGENLLLTFTKIGKDIFPEATQTMLDMSQALGTDLKGSAIQLGKALNDPIQGVTALRRVGVSFSESQLDMIEKLQKSGDLLGAQKIVLKELATEFGGSALAASKTFSGQIEIMKNNLNDTQEILGEGLVNALAQFTGGLGGANTAVLQLNEFLTAHKDLVIGISTALLLLVGAFGILLVGALAAMAGISLAFAGLVALLVGSIGFLLGVFIYHFNAIKNNWDVIVKYMGDQFTAFGQLWNQRMQEIDNNFTSKMQHMGQQFEAFGQLWQSRMREIDGNFKNMLEGLRNAFNNFLSWLGNLVSGFRPNIRIGIDLPDIEGAWRSLRDRAHKLGIPGFATGGIVPGQIGSPQLVMAHGGEEIVPHRGDRQGGGGRGSVNFNVTVGLYAGSAIEKRRIAEELYKTLVIYAGTQNKKVADLLGG